MKAVHRRCAVLLSAFALAALAPAGDSVAQRCEPSSLAPEMRVVIDEVIGDASVISLAESSHFLEEFHRFGVEAFKYMVEEHGVRLFVLETMWAIEENIMAYIDSEATEIPRHQALYLNAFGSDQMKALLLWIRAWNRAHPDDPVIVSGYQPEQPVTDATAIKAFFASSAIEIPTWAANVLEKYPFFNGEHRTDLDSIVFSSGRYRAGELIYTPQQRLEILDALIAIEDVVLANRTRLVAEVGNDAIRELEMHVLSLRTSIDTLTYSMDLGNTLSKDDPEFAARQNEASSAVYRIGDMVRAKIFFTLRETRHRNRRAVIWMHNWHAAKRAERLEVVGTAESGGMQRGTASFGSRVFRVLGDDYVVIASLTRCGTCEIDRSDSLEDAFHARFGEDTAIVNLSAAGDLEETVTTPGTAYAQNHNMLFRNLVLSEQFDAVVYFPGSGLTVERN